MTQTSPIRNQAIELLGRGFSSTVVAETLGVTAGRISQLMEDPEFKSEVTQRRIKALSQATELDQEYHDLENKLVKRLKQAMPLMTKPMDIIRGIQVINGAKRRGSPDGETNERMPSQIVQINMPVSILQQFTNDTIKRNSDNQIIQAGEQGLITVQSGKLDKLMSVEKSNEQLRISSESKREKQIQVGAICAEDLE